VDVGVDRQGRDVRAEEEDAGRGLASHAGKRREQGDSLCTRQTAQVVEVNLARRGRERAEDSLDALSFDDGEAAGADGLDQIAGRGVAD